MMDNIVKTIFFNNRIEICVKPDLDYRYVRCINHIYPYELILVEHVILGTMDELGECIKFNKTLYTNLYPRTNNELTNELASEKLFMNQFISLDNSYIGYHVSMFNHSTTMNAMVKFYKNYAYIYALTDIYRNDEIFIYYGEKYFNDGIVEIPHDEMKYSNQLNFIISTYNSTDIEFNQRLAKMGLHVLDGKFITTNKFISLNIEIPEFLIKMLNFKY